jgi:hypothetical protein
MNLRRRKPEPAPAPASPEEQLGAALDWAVSRLATAVVRYAQTAGEDTPQMLIDGAGRLALEQLAYALTDASARLDDDFAETRPSHSTRLRRVLENLTLGYGIPRILACADEAAQAQGDVPFLAVMEARQAILSSVEASADGYLAEVE